MPSRFVLSNTRQSANPRPVPWQMFCTYPDGAAKLDDAWLRAHYLDEDEPSDRRAPPLPPLG
jgi:hypothetical protein